MVFTYRGEDVGETIIRFAREYMVGHIVLGTPAPIPRWKRILGKKSIPERLMEEVYGATIVVLDTRSREPVTSKAAANVPKAFRSPVKITGPVHEEPPVVSMDMIQGEDHIKIWERPVAREEAIAALVRAVCGDQAPDRVRSYIHAVREREEQGSTFFNEGVAFPHARIPGLAAPLVALGLTRKGVSDLVTEKPVEFIFLCLTPNEKPEIQIQLLALAARNLQNRHLRQALQSAGTAQDAYKVLRSWNDTRLAPQFPS
jgi:two-component system sensor histidine kinase KdpD